MRDWSTWPEEYYKTTDPEERYEILTERLESGEAEEKDQIRMKFWELRYAKREKIKGRSFEKSSEETTENSAL